MYFILQTFHETNQILEGSMEQRSMCFRKHNALRFPVKEPMSWELTAADRKVDAFRGRTDAKVSKYPYILLTE